MTHPAPQHIREAVASLDPTLLPGAVSDPEIACAGAKFHSPTPLTMRSYDLKGAVAYVVSGEKLREEGPDRVWLCGTCVANLKVLLLVLHAHDGELPWEVRREFGNRLRAVAFRAWKHYRAVEAVASPPKG